MGKDPKSDYTAMMKHDLEVLIEELVLDALQKKFLCSRWLDQLIWMEAASKKNQRFYYILRLGCIIGGVIIPALVSIHASGALGGLVQFVTVMLSLVVAVSAALEEFFHFGERWRHYRRTAELLKGEGWSFFQLSGHYQSYKDHKGAYSLFAARMEETFQREVDIFITKISKESENQKEPSGGSNTLNNSEV